MIERIVHDQTNKFLSENDISYSFQFGFRPNNSTNLCLPHLTGKIFKKIDDSLLNGMILIDFQKAFDTLNHEVFLQKLKVIRFSEQGIHWIRSYLCDQIFLVETENKLSDFGKISCGVPQGSILGPLLFLIYVNERPQEVKSNLLLYSDDSCLMYQHKDIVKVKKIFNEHFENICDWSVDDKLSIHFGDDRTKVIISASNRRAKNIRKLTIRYKK